MGNTDFTPTSLQASEVTQIKTYTQKGTGIKFATASNWKQMLLQPKSDAIATTMVTALGHTFTVYSEKECEAYDPEAAKAKKEKIAKIKAEMRDLEKDFLSHKISSEVFTQRSAKLAQELTKVL